MTGKLRQGLTLIRMHKKVRDVGASHVRTPHPPGVQLTDSQAHGVCDNGPRMCTVREFRYDPHRSAEHWGPSLARPNIRCRVVESQLYAGLSCKHAISI
jgi:hypothetical protein